MWRKLVGLVLILGAAACAKPAEVASMIAPVTEATRIADASPLRGRIEIAMVSGGQETSPLWQSEVGNAEFRAALAQSLTQHGLIGTGPLRLEVGLSALDQPFAGISMTVTGTVVYTLRDAAGAKIFSEIVVAPYTAQFSEAVLGVERLRKANEGAIRANIARFIEVLKREADRTPALFAPAGPPVG